MIFSNNEFGCLFFYDVILLIASRQKSSVTENAPLFPTGYG